MTARTQAPWWWARLRAMSLPEIGWRIRAQWNEALESRRAGQESFEPSRHRSGTVLRSELREHLQPLVPNARWRNQFVQEFPSARKFLEEQAARVVQGTLPVFARQLDCGQPSNWHLDPVTQKISPPDPAAAIDYRDRERVGDARRIWEINRHHHLSELAQWAWIREDIELGRHVVGELMRWCNENPPLVGINWTSSLELAIRTLAWAEILALLTDMDESVIMDEELELLVGAWGRQIEYIRSHDSRYSSANNHRIGEAAAVAVAGLVLQFYPQAISWWRWGKETLEQEIALQFYEDGVGAEQAFAYQRFVLDFALLVRLFATRNGLDLTKQTDDRLEMICEFLSTVTRPDGSIFAVGDDDEGRAFSLGERYEDRTLASLECAGWMFRQPRWRRGSFARAGWLNLRRAGEVIDGDEEPLEKGVPDSAALRVLSRRFEQGGYCTIDIERGDIKRAQLLFDTGPLGYGALAAHGHADSLSLSLWAGEDILIDPGTGSYHGDPELRESLRGTRSHNTCELDGSDQSERRGLFLWGERAQSRVLASGAQSSWFILAGAHDGYKRNEVPEVRRIIGGHASPDSIQLVVVDEVVGTGNHRVRVPWHLGSGVPERIDSTDQSSFLVRYPGGAVMTATARVLAGGSVDDLQITALEHGAPFSSRFGESKAGGEIAIQARADLSVTVVWILSIWPKTERGVLDPSRWAVPTIRACDGGVSCRLDLDDGSVLKALIAEPSCEEVREGSSSSLTGRVAVWKEGEATSAASHTIVAGATAFRCGLLAWKSPSRSITGVLSALAPRAHSFSPQADETGSDQ